MSKRQVNIEIGAELENHVAQQIRAVGLDPKARRNPDSGSGNREKADIDTSLQILGERVHIECKNWARHGMAEWLRHAEYGSSMTHGTPLLVYKLRKQRLHEARAIIGLDTLLELIKKAEGEVGVRKLVDIDSKNARYFADKLKTAAAKLAKLAAEDTPNPRLLAYARQEVHSASKGLQDALVISYGN